MEQQQEGTLVEYAGFWIRLGAYIIDGVILGVINLVASFIFVAIVASAEPGDTGLLAGLTGGFTVVIFILTILYFIGFWAWRGQTPGKMAVGVKIVNTDGSSISVGKSILRYIGYIVSGIIIYIGFLMIAWDGEKQGLHDKIAGTYVVKT